MTPTLDELRRINEQVALMEERLATMRQIKHMITQPECSVAEAKTLMELGSWIQSRNFEGGVFEFLSVES